MQKVIDLNSQEVAKSDTKTKDILLSILPHLIIFGIVAFAILVSLLT